ncbi:MAG: Ribulose-phosphate 3-epimerase [uncultured bacterium]|nr:MAG: Ribulose-phosphate 3-epimerase [uncultured bacterium]
MISHPHKYIKNFADAGADYLTVHAEADHDLKRTIEEIKKLNIKAGPAINPDGDLSLITDVLDISDIVLVMSVFPGFGGQKFMPEVLSKVKELVILRNKNNYRYEIEIDGGINLDNCTEVKKSGVDIIVAGTALYGSKNMQLDIKKMGQEKSL